MIDVQGLGVRFGANRVIDGLSFGLPEGGSLALWGVNGAGKTTVLRALLDQVPYTGHVTVAGYDAHRQGRQARTRLGYVPQQLAFYDDLSALGLLRFVAGLRGAPQGQALALLQRMGLGDQARKAVGALSGGMKQRLALAAALLGDPPILMLDEPTASLDVAAREDFTALLLELRAAGKTLLFTSHRVDEVAALADEAIVLDPRGARRVAARELDALLHPEVSIRLVVAEGAMGEALAVLTREGFDARRNGHGVVVRVAAGNRAAPVTVLVQADIAVHDLTLEVGG